VPLLRPALRPLAAKGQTMKYWDIFIRMYTHDRTDSHWAFCCRTTSTEMLGIVERALNAAGQETKVQEAQPIQPYRGSEPGRSND